MTPLSVSIVICAYTQDRWASLIAAVAEAHRQMRPNDELILVIDHNPDMLARCRPAFAECIVVANAEAKGLSGARNTGVARASGDIVVFLDDDAVPEPQWLESLLAGYSSGAVLGVGGLARPLWAGPAPRWFPEEFLWVVGCSYRGLPDAVAPVRNFIGANMSIRRSVLEAVGGFESSLGRVGTLPAGCEETEMGIRIRQASPSSVLLHQPGSSVRHLVPESRATLKYFLHRCWAEGRSKAVVSALVGSDDALSSERSYVSRVLPRAVGLGILQTFKGERFGVARATAIVLGLLATAAGYATARPSARTLRPRVARALPAIGPSQ